MGLASPVFLPGDILAETDETKLSLTFATMTTCYFISILPWNILAETNETTH